jgi:hypothetical protein
VGRPVLRGRVSAALCTAHAEDATDVWPSASFDDLLAGCSPCEAAADRLRDSQGSLLLGTLPHLSVAEFNQMTAIHEAGHTIVGVLTDHPVIEVAVSPFTGAIQTEPGGGMTLGPFDLPVDEHCAMLWAGQSAALRWIIEHGHDTPDNRIDIAYLGWHDVSQIRAWTDRYDIPLTTGRRFADRLLTKHWATVEALAGLLLQHGRVSGAAVNDLLNVTTR